MKTKEKKDLMKEAYDLSISQGNSEKEAERHSRMAIGLIKSLDEVDRKSERKRDLKLLIITAIMLLATILLAVKMYEDVFGPKILSQEKQIISETEEQRWETQVLKELNATRREYCLPEWGSNPYLAKSSQEKAARMVELKIFSHTLPKIEFGWFIEQSGFKGFWYGENLARGFESPEATVEAWMNSPRHKALILSEKYDRAGVGYIEGYTLNGFTNAGPLIVLHAGGDYSFVK